MTSGIVATLGQGDQHGLRSHRHPDVQELLRRDHVARRVTVICPGRPEVPPDVALMGFTPAPEPDRGADAVRGHRRVVEGRGDASPR
jgi:hypothetical protein